MGQTLFTNVKIFDGNSKRSYAGQVLLQGNLVKKVAKGQRKIRANGADVIDGAGAGNALVEPLRQAGLTVTVTTARQMAIAFGVFYDSVLDERLRHLDQTELNYALSVARKRAIGDGGHGWSRRDSESNITPVVAATLALWGLTSDDIELPPKKRTGRAVFV